MSDCQRFKRSIERLLGDEIGQEELERLLSHTQVCAGCESLFELHHDLSDPQLRLSDPEQADLMGVRRAVLREIRTREGETRDATAPSRRWPARMRPGLTAWLRPGLASWLRPGLASWLRPDTASWLRPALATGLAAGLVVLALGVGFVMGRGEISTVPVTGRGNLVPEIERAAYAVESLQDTAESPYVYSNLRLRDAGDGRVALSFDVATHLDMIRPKDDPLVSEVLVQAMLQDESLGGRLKAISHAAELVDPRVDEALILVMLRDPSLPVRMKALSQVASTPATRQVEEAMLQVLENEESVQMRLQAIDYLSRGELPRDELHRAINSGAPSQSIALRARARRYVYE